MLFISSRQTRGYVFDFCGTFRCGNKVLQKMCYCSAPLYFVTSINVYGQPWKAGCAFYGPLLMSMGVRGGQIVSSMGVRRRQIVLSTDVY